METAAVKPSVTKSWILTICGWARAIARRTSRFRSSMAARSLATSSGRNFSAVSRPSSSSRASQTTPMPPRPRIFLSV